MSRPAINKRLARLAQMSYLHICEPVIASTIVQRRGSVRGSMFASVADAILPDDLLTGTIHDAVDGGIDAARERRRKAGKVKLFPTMYMVMGPTTFGLYELPTLLGEAPIGETVLYLARNAVMGLDLEQRRGLFQNVTLRVAASTPLPLMVHRAFVTAAQQVQIALTGAPLPGGQP